MLRKPFWSLARAREVATILSGRRSITIHWIIFVGMCLFASIRLLVR
jgi:hypothetical protein